MEWEDRAAELFKRVFKEDVLRCPKCAGPMKVLAFITDRETIEEILDSLGLPSIGPPLAKARRLLQNDFDFVA